MGSLACQTDKNIHLANEEAQIYKTLLANKPRQIVVNDETKIGMFGEIENGGLKEILTGLRNDTFESLAKRNLNSSEFHFASIEGFDYQILNRTEFDKFQEKPSRYYVFSRVGFSKDGKQAVVMFIQACDLLCSKGAYYLLSKENGTWLIDEESEMWRS